MTRFGLSLMPEPGFAAAALPLFEAGLVDAVEWSFDMGWGPSGVPEWLDAVAADYGNQGWLLGHGVSYSLLGAEGHHEQWLKLAAREAERRTYRWMTEHVGFVGAGRFSFAAPMPAPAVEPVIELGQRRLRQYSEAVGTPVGVENLATCLGPQDAIDQGWLVTQLLGPVDGILLLDLHNLWCQSINAGVALDALLNDLPLERVREMHVSGGTWSQSTRSTREIRRDTHDELVPPELFDLLPLVAARCPNLEVVIYERLGTALADPTVHDAYRRDVTAVADLVHQLRSSTPAAPSRPVTSRPERTASDDLDVASYQARLLDELVATTSGDAVLQSLATEFEFASGFDPDLLEVAGCLTRQWGRIEN